MGDGLSLINAARSLGRVALEATATFVEFDRAVREACELVKSDVQKSKGRAVPKSRAQATGNDPRSPWHRPVPPRRRFDR